MQPTLGLILFPVVTPTEQLQIAPVEFRHVGPDPVMRGELVMGTPIRLDEVKLQIQHRATDSTTPAELVSQPNPAGIGPMRFFRHISN